MAEETTVNQVESEKIEPEDIDTKVNSSEGLINQVEFEIIEPEDISEKATPSEGLINQVESEKIEPQDVDAKVTPSEGLINQVSEIIEPDDVDAKVTPKIIELEDVDLKATPNEGLIKQVESEIIEPEDVDAKATPSEGLINEVESEIIEPEDCSEKATPSEGLIKQVESEIIQPEDVDAKATPSEELISQVESEIIEPEDVDAKATSSEGLINQVESEITEPEDVDAKATSSEGLIITKGPPKILPRYLSGPKSSCHDICKYGIPTGTRAKPWSTAQKKVTKTERKTKVPRENVTSLAWKKKSGRTSNHSPLSSKSDDPNDYIDIKEVTNEKTVTSEKISPSFEETDVSMELNKSNIREETSELSSLLFKECSKNQTKRELVKNKVGFGSSSRKETDSRSNQKRTSLTRGNQKSTPSNMLFSSKQNLKKSSSSSSSSSAKTAKNLRRVSSLEEVKPELAHNDNLPDKILHVIEPTLACDASKLPSPSPSPTPSSSRDKSLKRTSKKTSKSGASASSRKGLRHVGHGTASAANRGKINLQQKMDSVSRSPSVLSTVSSSNSSVRKQKGATSKSNKAGGYGNHGENVKVGYKMRPKRTTIVGAANKVISPWKLTFRRGRVIEIQPQSNNIPRRLKFRPARLLSSDDIRRDVNGTRKRTITNKEVDGGGELNIAANIIKTERVVPKHQILEGGKNRSFARKVILDRSNLYSSKSGTEKVVLRHQKVEGKKQNPRLYNNVIEETASMLAELRKSKVKALVGAFETVISLDSPRGEATSTSTPTPTELTTAC